MVIGLKNIFNIFKKMGYDIKYDYYDNVYSLNKNDIDMEISVDEDINSFLAYCGKYCIYLKTDGFITIDTRSHDKELCCFISDNGQKDFKDELLKLVNNYEFAFNDETIQKSLSILFSLCDVVRNNSTNMSNQNIDANNDINNLLGHDWKYYYDSMSERYYLKKDDSKLTVIVSDDFSYLTTYVDGYKIVIGGVQFIDANIVPAYSDIDKPEGKIYINEDVNGANIYENGTDRHIDSFLCDSNCYADIILNNFNSREYVRSNENIKNAINMIIPLFIKFRNYNLEKERQKRLFLNN